MAPTNKDTKAQDQDKGSKVGGGVLCKQVQLLGRGEGVDVDSEFSCY